MPQPTDYANGYDPYKTDPLFVQLVDEDGVEMPDSVDRGSQRDHQCENDGCDDPTAKRWPKRVFGGSAKKGPDPSHGISGNRFFDFLVPFNDPWRLTIGFAVFFLLMNMVASRGWLPVIGLSPFASAASVTEIKVGLIEGQIFDTIKEHCTAPTSDSKTFYARRRGELLAQFETTTGKPYRPIPTCRDLGVREVVIGDP